MPWLIWFDDYQKSGVTTILLINRRDFSCIWKSRSNTIRNNGTSVFILIIKIFVQLLGGCSLCKNIRFKVSQTERLFASKWTADDDSGRSDAQIFLAIPLKVDLFSIGSVPFWSPLWNQFLCSEPHFHI